MGLKVVNIANRVKHETWKHLSEFCFSIVLLCGYCSYKVSIRRSYFEYHYFLSPLPLTINVRARTHTHSNLSTMCLRVLLPYRPSNNKTTRRYQIYQWPLDHSLYSLWNKHLELVHFNLNITIQFLMLPLMCRSSTRYYVESPIFWFHSNWKHINF